MQLSQREAERQERRATNLIWNAARDYSLAPVVRAYDTEAVQPFTLLEQPKIRKNSASHLISQIIQ